MSTPLSFIITWARGKCLQVTHNACVTGYVPFIASFDVKSHITHCRLTLAWLFLASCRFLQLLVMFYRIVSTSSPNHQYQTMQSRPPLSYEPTFLTRGPSALFSFKRARMKAWSVSFRISGQWLANRLRILCSEPERVSKFNSLVVNIFWRVEINAWQSRAIRERYVPVSDIDLLPHPTLPLYEAAFTNPGKNGSIW